MKNFKLSTNVYFGQDSLSILDEIQGKNVLIICDKFIKDSGIADKVASHLTGNTVNVFADVVPDPPIEVVAEGINCLKSVGANIIIAVGGGSSIDAAKAIRELGTRMNVANVEKCYAIPTTSGTGSEVTQFSVITDASKGVKYPLVLESLQPMVAILDPDLVASVPPNITADTGMDALTHALEAYVSTNANDFTDALAEKAITLLVRFLPYAYAHGDDMEAREKVHNAACLAGMAFNMVGVGICHSIAHQIGAKFHMSHGRANAMVLPYVVDFNAQISSEGDTKAAKKYQRVARLIGLPYSDAPLAVSSLIHKIQDMQRVYGVPPTLRSAGISKEQFYAVKDSMIAAAMDDICTESNPRKVCEKDFDRLLMKMF
ncbi:MAG: iron-containing alcohol dehydrogenase [Firmicutes bacterium]|nr:iron-containing alcohol dehydrogenase [Bacillota bacterium]